MRRAFLLFTFAACNLAHAGCEEVTDWLVASHPLAAPVRPAPCQTVEQTPPDFSWPDVAPRAVYSVTLTYPDGRSRTLEAPQNYLNWDEPLPPGRYRWRVTAREASGTRESRARSFTVAPDAKPFVVPPMDEVLARLEAKPRPRGLPDAATLQAMAKERPKVLAELRAEAAQLARRRVQPEPDRGSTGSNNAAAFDEAKRTLTALAAYALMPEPRHFDEALRRVRNLASWDPEGHTAYHMRGMDMSARMVTWAVTLGFDWLHPRLAAEDRELFRRTLRARLRHMHEDVIGSRARIARFPRNSHGQLSATMLGVMAALLAGEFPEAEAYARDTLPLGLNLVMPWGGEDGGFANGTPYAIWDVGESLPYWTVLRWASGIDLADKAWVRNFGRFLAYFAPPGSPAALFGDGLEQRQLVEQLARFGKAYAAFAPSPLMRWYAGELSGEDPRRFAYAMAPLGLARAGAPLPPGTPQALHVPSIGWVAMHSDLARRERVSVYFKSSPPPFGAFNHQHADQNSFVINAGGERLAIESGYYDRYKSPHWRDWLKTTRAKNAITYDGGRGQVSFENDDGKLGYGRITQFDAQPGYAIAAGDASAAYDGALTRAARALVYLRPDVVLVHDRLASRTPRRWEWNIHALERMAVASDRAIRIERGGEKLCVDLLAGPPVEFAQTDAWTAPPGKGEPQWHGRFTTRALAEAEFLVLLRVGCRGIDAAAERAGRGWRVRLGAAVVAIDGDGRVRVAP